MAEELFFDYDLPEGLIAQEPAAQRDESRLLHIQRATGELAHHQFRALPSLLRPGDLLVLNNTRVIPARLQGRRSATGGKWEALYLGTTSAGHWEVLAQTRGYPREGEQLETPTGLVLTLVGRTPERHWLLQPATPGSAADLLGEHGEVPLPPYIRKGRAADPDRERYQTVYAKVAGSVAAPTAGLHFTPAILQQLRDRGVGLAEVTLHVGLGTFAPIQQSDPREHALHAEWCEAGPAAVEQIHDTRRRGGRVIAVGTTTTRTLEAAARPDGLKPFRGETQLYIYPPFEFRVVDGLITNFHLPRTTLLLLVQSLCGSTLLRRAYQAAIAERYRFFSYGDAMLIL